MIEDLCSFQENLEILDVCLCVCNSNLEGNKGGYQKSLKRTRPLNDLGGPGALFELKNVSLSVHPFVFSARSG